MFCLLGTRNMQSQWCNRLLLFCESKKPSLSLYLVRRFFMCRKKLIPGSLIVILTLAVVITSVSFSFNVSDISGSFVSKASVSGADRDSIDIVQVTANIEAAGISGSIAEDVEDNLASAAKDIYDVNMARTAEAEARSRAASSQTGPTGADLSSLEAEVLRLINKVRADHGLSQLEANQSLTDIARTRTGDMLSKNYFSHYAPDGSTFFTILRNCGISYTNGGENLGNATPAGYGSPKAFINAWMNSPSHRDNMLRGPYRLIGIGISDSGGRRVVTTIFLN